MITLFCFPGSLLKNLTRFKFEVNRDLLIKISFSTISSQPFYVKCDGIFIFYCMYSIYINNINNINNIPPIYEI